MRNKLNRIIKEETRRVLLEVTMEQAKARFNSKAFLKVSEEYSIRNNLNFKTKLESSMFYQESIERMIPNDIASRFKPEALWWAISTFIKTRTLSSTVKPYLETFFQIKEAGKGSILTKPDINQIQSWDELEQVVTQAKPAWEEHKQSKANKDWEAGSNLIYEDQNWQVFIPENKGAACKLGKGTEWCTAAPGLDYYEQYHKPEDPLIIFINKQDPEDKYQFHYDSGQFMDRDDQSITNQILFYQLNDIVKRLAKKLPKKTIELANQYAYEELESGGYKTIGPERVSYYNDQGEFHRLDGPAIVDKYGTKSWHQNGKPHRLDGPAIEFANGDKEWFQNGKRHRLDGPAIEWSSGYKEWYQNDKLHRLDGPAIEETNGHKYWYIEGRLYSEQDFNQKVKKLKAQQNLREHFMRYL